MEHSKTAETLLINKRSKNKEIVFEISGSKIELQKEVKYLGIVVDKTLSMVKHIKQVCEKAEKTLQILLPNIDGPGEKKRRGLANCVSSIILYGAPT